jgi:hypothetical protein
LRCLLLLEEYRITLEYLPGKKYVNADALSRLDIDSLKIQEETQEEALTLLSGLKITASVTSNSQCILP